jgi:hypothetical protein
LETLQVMRKLSFNRLRIENNQALKKYEAYGTRLFQNALRNQSEEFDPMVMENAYIEFYQNVFVDAAKRNFNQIRLQNQKNFIADGFFLSTWREWIGQWVNANLGTMIQNINQNTLEKIQSALSVAISDGLNPFQTAKFIKDTIGSKARALAIARTESTRANNMGLERSANDWANETGTELWKQWIHGGSKEAREEHIMLASNPPIRKYEKFDIGGGMDMPGDQSAPPEQTINCSCFVQYLSDDYVRRFYPEVV